MTRVVLRYIQGLTSICILAFGTYVSAQTITLRLVDGNTGKPFSKQNLHVTFWWEDPSSPNKDKWRPLNWPEDGMEVYVDKTGVAHIPVPAKATKIDVREGLKIGKDPYRVPYLDCTATFPLISIADVLERGFVPENRCNKNLNVKSSPGEFIFFGKPIPWWMPDMQ
jgi:hypothetical protein